MYIVSVGSGKTLAYLLPLAQRIMDLKATCPRQPVHPRRSTPQAETTVDEHSQHIYLDDYGTQSDVLESLTVQTGETMVNTPDSWSSAQPGVTESTKQGLPQHANNDTPVVTTSSVSSIETAMESDSFQGKEASGLHATTPASKTVSSCESVMLQSSGASSEVPNTAYNLTAELETSKVTDNSVPIKDVTYGAHLSDFQSEAAVGSTNPSDTVVNELQSPAARDGPGYEPYSHHEPDSPSAIILVPTRELVLQVIVSIFFAFLFV